MNPYRISCDSCIYHKLGMLDSRPDLNPQLGDSITS